MALIIKAEVSLEASAFLFRGWVWLAVTVKRAKFIFGFDKKISSLKKQKKHAITCFLGVNIFFVVWGANADKVSERCTKGTHVTIVGRLTSRSYEDANNIKRYITDVVANEDICKSS